MVPLTVALIDCSIVKWLYPIIALILYYPVLNLVHTTSDSKGTPKYELPRCDSEMYKKSFLPRCLFRYV